MKKTAMAALTAAFLLSVFLSVSMGASAHADSVGNGRIAWSSFRVDPPPGEERTGDIFTMNPDGSDVRQLTNNPKDDAQADWSPDGQYIAYRIRKPNWEINYEIARMTADGTDHQQITHTPDLQASGQPSWNPDGSLLFRRSGSGFADIWAMGPFGENPHLLADIPGRQWYPSYSPDMTRLLFATTQSPNEDTDRGVFTSAPDGSGLETVFDVPGAYDSAPAWRADGAKIAFESNADVAGGNPEHDMEIWTVNPDGSSPCQLTHNTAHDEGPAWSPDGTMLAYTSGPDDFHGDIHVMTATGTHLRQLTFYPGRDESPDWQPVQAP